MSLVYITHHNENIYNFEKELDGNKIPHGLNDEKLYKKRIQQDMTRPIRQKLNMEQKKHHIIHLENGERLLTSSPIYEHRTMGCAKTPMYSPCAFLHKNAGVKWHREKEHICPNNPSKLPAVPRRTECKKTLERTYVNFVKRNIENMRVAKPRRARPHYVDTPNGERHELINSGLIPQYICRKNYGKVPCYIDEHKKKLKECHKRYIVNDKKMKEICQDMARAKAIGTADADLHGVRLMTPQERDEILQGLKKRLLEETKVYQSMSLYMDTESKKLRKYKLEVDIQQVEQDISILENNPVIYISAV